jgi:hypothetical protein
MLLLLRRLLLLLLRDDAPFSYVCLVDHSRSQRCDSVIFHHATSGFTDRFIIIFNEDDA